MIPRGSSYLRRVPSLYQLSNGPTPACASHRTAPQLVRLVLLLQLSHMAPPTPLPRADERTRTPPCDPGLEHNEVNKSIYIFTLQVRRQFKERKLETL